MRDNRVLGGLDFLSGQDRIRLLCVGGGTLIGRTCGRPRNSRSPGRHWTVCRVRKARRPAFTRGIHHFGRARPGFPAPHGFPRRSPSPGPTAGLSTIRQGGSAVHRTTRPQPYARGEAPQPRQAPGKARPRRLHGDLPDARTHGIARQPGRNRLGSRAGAAGHHRFAARRLLRHRRRLETPRPPSGPAPGHHSSRARGHRRTRTRPRTPPMAPVVERTATVLRTGGTAGRTETTAERTTGNTKGAAPGPKSRGSPARSRSGRAQRVTRPC